MFTFSPVSSLLMLSCWYVISLTHFQSHILKWKIWEIFIIKLNLFSNFVGSSIQTTDYVLEIVAYEAHRLFRDKIVGKKELRIFDNILMKVFQDDWDSDVLDNMAGKPFRHTTQTWNISSGTAWSNQSYELSIWADLPNFQVFPFIFTDIFYVTWGACQEAFITPGQALPPHGKPLGRLNSTDLTDIIQKVRQV